MLSPPPDLTEDTLAATLAGEWWLVRETGGTRWFVTVDELDVRDDPLDVAFHWLRASLAAATSLRAHGYAFAVTPIPTTAHRHAVLDLIVAIHQAPEAVRRLLARFDELVAAAPPGREVLTHGEPHPGNTMRTPAGWRLIDWDTVLLAPPERDLWTLDPGDGSILDAYTAATGVRPLPAMLELYRLRWDLLDLSELVTRFRRPHSGDANDDKSWEMLRSLVGGIGNVEG